MERGQLLESRSTEISVDEDFPACFVTFADNPITSARIAEEKLRVIAQAAEVLRRG